MSDRCSQCGICARECPVGAIDLENSVLMAEEKCILCCACSKACPENARTLESDAAIGVAVRLSQLSRKEPEYFF
ncbi:DUF362 domain-containing protein [Acididesulfobacillus acetoxydans]|uniref:DUF362 domain-containing protein n=1 Tax=Acididesulfobacillus acetoxydans TaxID=1561005 RepID=UPI001F1163B2|nr:4Fe-4S binding protein [Acididesulfobacillus acetoxydans]